MERPAVPLPPGSSPVVAGAAQPTTDVASARRPDHTLTRFTSERFEVVVIESSPPTVQVTGHLGASAAPLLAAVLNGQIGQGHADLCLDLSRLTHATAAGLAPVASCRRRCRDLGGRATVVGIRSSHVPGLRLVVAPRSATQGGEV